MSQCTYMQYHSVHTHAVAPRSKSICTAEQIQGTAEQINCTAEQINCTAVTV